MTQEEFDTIFDSLYYGCVQPAENGGKVYAARSKSYWFHFQHVRAEFFEQAVMRYLAAATEGPFFPALGELREISGEIAARAKEAAEKEELKRLKEKFPEAEQTAADIEAMAASAASKMNALTRLKRDLSNK